MFLQGNGSGHGERKQAWQALTGPFGSSQCLQLGERKHESGYICVSLNHLNTETFKRLTIESLKAQSELAVGYESGHGELKQAWKGQVGLIRAWNHSMKRLTM